MTKISIRGTAPKYEDTTLKLRQEARHNVYDQTDEYTTLVRGDIPIQFLSNLIDHHTKGYTLSMKYPVSFGSGSYSCRMEKPESIRTADKAALDTQVKLEYITWLESERENYKQLFTAQLLQAAEAKEKKKEEDKRAKLFSEIEKEVSATFGDLVVPD